MIPYVLLREPVVISFDDIQLFILSNAYMKNHAHQCESYMFSWELGINTNKPPILICSCINDKISIFKLQLHMVENAELT